MDWYNKIFAKGGPWDKLSGDRAPFTVSLILVVLFALALIALIYAEVSENKDVGVFIWSVAIGGFFLFLGVSGFLYKKVHRQKSEDIPGPKAKDLYVVAWSGFEKGDIFEKNLDMPEVHVLEYIRGIDKVNRLRFHNKPFDVVVADIESFPRLHKERGFYEIMVGSKAEEWKGMMAEGIYKIIPQGVATIAVPIRWGFNDILVNMSKVKDNELLAKIESNKATWFDFRLENLLNMATENQQIGIWNWWLPSLLSLSMTIKPNSSLEKAHETEIDKIQSICEALSKGLQDKKIMLFNEPSIATTHLIREDVMVLIGGGSMLRPYTQLWDLRSVCPQEGVFLWIECAGVVAELITDEAKGYIESLLSVEAQGKLMGIESKEGYQAYTSEYRALPVNGTTLKREWQKLDAIFKQKQILDRENFKFFKGKVCLRTVPQAMHRWEEAWEQHVQMRIN